MLAVGAGLLGTALSEAAQTGQRPPAGGTFRIGWTDEPDAIDPALASPFTRGTIASLTCLTPMNYSDSKPTRLVADAATGFPRVSGGGKTYTFTIRRGLRFNTGEVVTARTFAATINRSLRVGLYPASAMDVIAGARDVVEHRADSATGVQVKGNRLVIRLTEPTPDFPYRTTLSGFCALPARLPADPEGARAPLPAAGPYYVASWLRGRRVVLARNRRYGGSRPHHVASYVIELNVDPAQVVSRIERGTLDTGDVPAEAHARLGRRYGVGRAQYFVQPVGLIYHAILNLRPGRFARVRLRRAANFAVDRAALVRAGARVQGADRFGAHWGTPTDQWLVPGFPGYRPAAIYPLRRPDVRRGRALTKGLRGVTLQIYARNDAPFAVWAQLVQRDLRRIGLESRISLFPPEVALEKVFGRPGEPWDLALVGAYGPDYPDPASTLLLFEGPPTPVKYRLLLDRAKRLHGAARYRLYGKLDVALAREVAPTVPFATLNLRTFVSRRVGCKVFHPELDLVAVCLKR